MKKMFTAFLALLILGSSFASVSSVPADFKPIPKKKYNAAELMIPIGSGDQKISLLDLSTISKADLEKMTGKKMKFLERMAFKSAQKKLQKGINKEGIVTNKQLKKQFYADGESGFHLGGFALGFLVGLIGVLIAYLIKDDYKKNRVKWAWLGLASAVVLGIVISLAIL